MSGILGCMIASRITGKEDLRDKGDLDGSHIYINEEYIDRKHLFTTDQIKGTIAKWYETKRQIADEKKAQKEREKEYELREFRYRYESAIRRWPQGLKSDYSHRIPFEDRITLYQGEEMGW